jgi:uncharacterized protein (UPF0147 family)
MKRHNKGSSKPTLGFPSRKAFIESDITSDQLMDLLGDLSFDKHVARAIRKHKSCNQDILMKMAIEHKNYGVRAATILFMVQPHLAIKDQDVRVRRLVFKWQDELTMIRIILKRLRVKG